MLIIETKTYHKGSGLFDIAKNIFQKTTNSALAKKVINSATTGNLKRAANSAVGKEIKWSKIRDRISFSKRFPEVRYPTS